MMEVELVCSEARPWVEGPCIFYYFPSQLAKHHPASTAGHLCCLTGEGATSQLPSASILGNSVRKRKDLSADLALGIAFCFKE